MSKNNWNPDQFRKYNTSDGYGDSKTWEEVFRKGLKGEQETTNRNQDNNSLARLADCKNKRELKDLYRKLIREVHPDAAGDTEDNKELTQRLNAEYDRLKKELPD